MSKYKVQVVNCYSLNVRSGAGTSYKVVSWAQKGQTFTSSKQSGSWYYLDEKKGWSSKDYLKVIQNLGPPKTTTTTPPKTLGTITIKVNTKAYDKINGTKVIMTITPQTVKYIVAKPPWYQVVTFKGNLWIQYTTAKPTTGVDYGKINDMFDQGDGDATSDKFLGFTDDKRKSAPAPAPSSTITETSAGTTLGSFGGKDPGIGDTTLINWNMDYGFMSANLDIIRKNLNVIPESKNLNNELFTRFNRFHTAFPQHHLGKTFAHVIFTRPSCNFMTGNVLHDQFEKDPLIYYLWNNNSNVIKGLTTHLSSTHDFHPYLSNAAMSFDVPDEVIKTTEHGETFTGYKLLYGKHNIESNTAGQFTVQYNDDQHYTIYKTHKAWIEYISRVYRGTARPTLDNMRHKILDYACSVYYFICAEDGETLLFWSKYFGVFPLNAPSSLATWSKGSGGSTVTDFGINYAYAMKEDFSPLTLAEFNKNSSQEFLYRKIYDHAAGGVGRSMVGAPFVESSKDTSGHSVYKLKFRS